MDPDDNVYETDLDSKWKWDEEYFQKNNDSYDNANEIEPWSNEDDHVTMLIHRDMIEEDNSIETIEHDKFTEEEQDDNMHMLIQRDMIEDDDHVDAIEHDEFTEEEPSVGSTNTCTFESKKNHWQT